MAYKEGGEEMTQQKENEALMEALADFCKSAECAAGCDEDITEDQAYSDILSHAGSAMASSYVNARKALTRPTQSSGDGEALRIGWWNDMRQRGVSQDVAIQKIMGALASFPAPIPAEREAVGEVVGAKPWYETDAHRDLSRIIPDMEGKIADAEKRFAHCLPDHLFAPLKASITELRVLRHELSALSAQPVSEQGEGWKPIDSAPKDGEALNGDFLSQLRKTNSERYDVWARRPMMLCEHCGRDEDSANASGHNTCSPPFVQQDHSFTKPHPYLTVSNDAGMMFDALELGGEVGELLNVVKKLEREERGWRGSRAAPEDFADECADVLICLDKLARRRGVDLASATIHKFNATSEKVGLPHKLSAPDQSVSEQGKGQAPAYRTPDVVKANAWDMADATAKACGYSGLVEALAHLPAPPQTDGGKA